MAKSIQLNCKVLIFYSRNQKNKIPISNYGNIQVYQLIRYLQNQQYLKTTNAGCVGYLRTHDLRDINGIPPNVTLHDIPNFNIVISISYISGPFTW